MISSGVTSGRCSASSSFFINGYTYDKSDYSTFNDPVMQLSGANDSPKKLRGGFLLYKHSLKDIELGLVYEKIGQSYHSRNGVATNPAFQILLEKLSVEKESIRWFVKKLKVFACLDWATSDDMHNKNLLMDVKLQKKEGRHRNIYEVHISRGEQFPTTLSVGMQVYVRAFGDEDTFAIAMINLIDVKTKEIELVFLELDQMDALLSRGYTFDIINNPSAFTFRSLIRSIDFVDALKMTDFVFPSLVFDETFASFLPKRNAMMEKIFSEKDCFNCEQKNAIVSILLNANGPYPFLLFGPPGTGKTATLVETVRQLILASKDNRILVCTPSNKAGDNFAEVLLNMGHLHPKYIFRMYSQSTSTNGRNEKLDEISYIPHEGFYGTPERDNMKMFRIIICTLSTSSYLISAGGLRGYFTHIIIDEAGQATEAETWLPIGGLADLKKTCVVLAGDPKQLGPVVQLKQLKMKQLGYEDSMLKRLIESYLYNNADGRSIILLKDNYRSHEKILQPISSLFYGGNLKPNLKDEQLSKFCNWKRLPKKGFPLIFHSSANSIEEKGAWGNTSCSNSVEANIVVGYVKDLIANRGVEEKNIGVISPYKNQVEKLQEALLPDYPMLTIDSVERFQGSEREIIVISTVRTAYLGFLCCDLRLNTTISRAKCLLIVVGNDDLLKQHSNWGKFIDYCKSNGGYIKNEKYQTPSGGYANHKQRQRANKKKPKIFFY